MLLLFHIVMYILRSTSVCTLHNSGIVQSNVRVRQPRSIPFLGALLQTFLLLQLRLGLILLRKSEKRRRCAESHVSQTMQQQFRELSANRLQLLHCCEGATF